MILSQFSMVRRVKIDPVLENNSWEVISYASEKGFGPSYWSVGDTKGVTLDGTIGTLTVSNLTIDAFIIGFDHNQGWESPGEHRIHWQFGKINDVMVGLVDSKYGGISEDGAKYFNWNHWGGYNYGGWAACDKRVDVYGSTNIYPTGYGKAKTSSSAGTNAPKSSTENPHTNTLMSALPYEMRHCLKSVVKYTDNKGGGTNIAANISGITDFLCDLSEFEVYGVRTYANEYEQSYQEQYTYYKDGNTKYAYKYNDLTVSVAYSLRSVRYALVEHFCIVSEDGHLGGYNARADAAICPIFFT